MNNYSLSLSDTDAFSIIRGFHNPFIFHILALSPQSTQSASENWGLIPMIPPGRGSDRRGINFSGYRQLLCRHVRVFWTRIQKNHLWLSLQLRCDPLLFLWLLYSLSRKTRHHELPRFWVLFSVGWLIERGCFYKFSSWLQWVSLLLPRQFSPFYLHPNSKCATIRNINKVYPPLAEVWSQRLVGGKFKTTLGHLTFAIMSNVAHTENHRQSRCFGIDGLINFPSIHKNKLAIKRLTHRVLKLDG